MMENVFLKLLNMSIAAGWLVLAIILLRLILKKAPRAILCVLWGIVGIRLILPVSLESVLSLIPSAETVPEDIGYAANPAIASGISAVNSIVNPLLQTSLAPDPTYISSVNPMQIVLFVAAWVWIIDMVGMLLYSLISYFRIVRKVREAVPMKENIWVCDHIDTPFILGVFRPRIYLPSSMSETDEEYVIAHEKAHLSRRDHWWKPIGFLLLTVYWFNPLLWVAYVLLCRDIEVACDQKVIRDMGIDIKKPYSEALINCSVPRKMISACPLAFGEVGIKSRIQSVLSYKKPAFWLILVAIATCAVVSVCFLTDPVSVSVTDLEDTRGEMLLSNDTQTVRFVYGDYYYETPFSEDIEKKLNAIKVKPEPVDEITTELLFEPFYKIIIDGENQLCFNSDLTECWLNGNVRPYSVYGIKDPAYVKDFLKDYVPTLSISDFDDYTHMGGSLDGSRRYFYATVLNVSEDYTYIEVLPATGTLESDYTANGALLLVYTALMSASIPELKIGNAVCVIYNGLVAESSPAVTLYGHSITKMGINTGLTQEITYWDSILYDIDGDGELEACTLGFGPTSGLSTFTFSASSDKGKEYYNCFWSDAYNSLHFKELFRKLYIRAFPQASSEKYDLFEVSIENGNIILTQADYKVDAQGNCAEISIGLGERLAYWGKQGVDSN